MSPPGKPLDNAVGHREEVLRAWMAEYGPALRRYFQKKVGPAEAEDLVQDVFVSLQVRGSAETIENVEGYLFRIAANALMRRHKRRGWIGPDMRPWSTASGRARRSRPNAR